MWRYFGGKVILESLYREVGGNYPPVRQIDVITVVAVHTGSRITC